jgi:succinyl-CoA synthetase beta subunit
MRVNLMEYMAREIYHKYQIPTTSSVIIDNLDELPSKVEGLTFPLVVKAQVQIGGRGKAGGVKFAENMDELADVCKRILGMNIRGYIVRKLLIAEKSEIGKECYFSIMLDRLTKGPVIIFSSMGGVDIEETARTWPDKIIKIPIDPLVGVKDYMARYILSRSGLDMELYNQFFYLLKKAYSMFCEYDCTLVEINPLNITDDNKLIALDGKVTIDDSALYRHSDILSFRDSLEEDELVLEARKFNFLYISCETNGSIAVMSNGSGMLMSCIDAISKRGMSTRAVLDLGGGATADRIKEAIRILLSNKDVKALFINIFGGITRCDEVAYGIKLAVEENVVNKLMVVRFEGTNKEKGIEILNSIKGNIVFVDGLREGVNEVHRRREWL